MRLPFVSRARYEEQERRADRAEGDAMLWQEASRAERARHDALLDKYHALRVSGANVPEPQPPIVTSPLAGLGPQTLAALDAMAKGQSGAVRRAMQARAIQLWHEMRDKDDRDSLVAKAVWHGEAVMAS